MSLVMINEAVAVLKDSNGNFTDKEREFVLLYALKTEDISRVKELVCELSQADKAGSEVIIAKYQRQYKVMPQWIENIENLLVCLEMYRIEEEKAVKRLAEVLKAYGIDISEDEIKETGTEELKSKVREETKEKMKEEGTNGRGDTGSSTDNQSCL